MRDRYHRLEAQLSSPALRIALLFAMAIAASVAATWVKSYLADDGRPALSSRTTLTQHN